MKKVYPAKDPDETLKYGFNWTPRNIGTEQIVDIDATVESGSINILSSSVDDVPNAREGQGTVHTITGGVDGETCEILLEATTDAVPPSIMQQTVYLPIRQK